MVRKIKRNVMPILMNDSDVLLGFSHGNIIKLNITNKQILNSCAIEKSLLRRLFSYSRLLTRRYGINEIRGVLIDANRAFVNYHKRFYLLDTERFTLSEVKNSVGANGAVLYLSKTSHGILFGDYGYNPSKSPMSIYCYNLQDNCITKLYTFADGSINHIHNFVEDEVTGRIWIFVGDFNESAAIYYTDDYFKTVNVYLSGNQQFRGCCGISKGNVLVYATDSPTEINHIYRSFEGNVQSIREINGSCIYGYSDHNHLIVSTTVENQTDELNNYNNNYKYNLGDGIKDWYVEVLDIETTDTFKVTTVLRVKKDYLPMMPFKYGCFRFPSNGSSIGIIAMGQAVKKYDQWLINIVNGV